MKLLILSILLTSCFAQDIPKHVPYVYSAVVTDVYDGDTVTVTIDLGFNVLLSDQKIRLLGVDTPELRGEEREEGLKVRDQVRKMILNKKVIIRTHKDKKGKYGRWLAEVFIEGKSINEWLKKEGYGEEQ